MDARIWTGHYLPVTKGGGLMARAKVNPEVLENRITKRYHKLHAPIVELVQALQDAIPPGTVLSDELN